LPQGIFTDLCYIYSVIYKFGGAAMSSEAIEQMLRLMVMDLRGVVNDQLRDGWTQRKNNHTNPFNRYGMKCFSQSDEDGLTLEIIRRLELQNGTFAELGVGNGTENNSLVLLASGWRGFWIGGQRLAVDVEASTRLMFIQDWISLSNLKLLFQSGLDRLGVEKLDVVSLDLDGNDIFLAESLLANFAHPELFIVEYNGKFPPPVEFSISYDPEFIWSGDDYFGASLTSFAKMFAKHGYTLICCNAATGANAFFVKNKHLKNFPEVPSDIREIFSPPHYDLPEKYGHNTAIKTVQQVIL